ncbi:hypothetical protein [Chryseobacterium sp.]|uniref:hypothetical protein n=1 Tax=Chryseobacterium sp. TaxID=1871047 RepID=UPI003219FFBD
MSHNTENIFKLSRFVEYGPGKGDNRPAYRDDRAKEAARRLYRQVAQQRALRRAGDVALGKHARAEQSWTYEDKKRQLDSREFLKQTEADEAPFRDQSEDRTLPPYLLAYNDHFDPLEAGYYAMRRDNGQRVSYVYDGAESAQKLVDALNGREA